MCLWGGRCFVVVVGVVVDLVFLARSLTSAFFAWRSDGGLPVGTAVDLLHDVPGLHRRRAGPSLAVRRLKGGCPCIIYLATATTTIVVGKHCVYY